MRGGGNALDELVGAMFPLNLYRQREMSYVVVYDKFLENSTWLLNARKTFKEKKEAITFARDCEHSAYTANVKVYEL